MPKLAKRHENDFEITYVSEPDEIEPGEEGWLENPTDTGEKCPVCGGEEHGDRDPDCEKAYLTGRLQTDRQFRRAFYQEIGEDTQLGFHSQSYSETIDVLWSGNYFKPAKAYAGIGSRDTPEGILEVMTRTAELLEERGWHLRSGGADGADFAFATAIDMAVKDVFLPFDGFNGWSDTGHAYTAVGENEEARALAKDVHPAWELLEGAGKKFHTRNACQILGENLKRPVRRVICWTPDGAEAASECSEETGGTATAIRLADKYDIPVDNLRNDGVRLRYDEWVGRHSEG